MVKHVHLVSGLPRSGSTLLCALLRQNPRFHAAMTSPVASLCGAMLAKTNGGEFGVFFDDAKRTELLHAVFNAYYSDLPDGTIVFDTNRSWTSRMPLLDTLYPQARVICCVREVGWIIDSIERMLAKNPLQLSRMFNYRPGASVYARADGLMNSEHGLIGLAWSTLREAWFGAQAKRLIVVPYESLAEQPRRTMERLYAALGEAPFEHDFDHVEYDEPDYDAHIGMPGLHKVRARVGMEKRSLVIPPELFAKYAPMAFWTKSELNRHGITVL